MSEPTSSDAALEGIAVIGLAGCYPGAADIEAYWRNLCGGIESISHFADDEHEWPAWADPGGQIVKSKGILADAESFDAAFFGYSPAEAKAMDPQHRLFLEQGWKAFEHAGYAIEDYPGPVGVFAGVSVNTYSIANMMRHRSAPALLTDKDFLATRLSYKLNLRGPSVVAQSACSTSLVAVALACQSLANYQCDMCLAGGSSVWAPIRSGYPYMPGGPLSPDGHCRAFDVQAGGFVPGSGVGAVVLKRLADARADGDTIWAVLKGWAVNNDGAAKVGYSAPSIDGQAEVVALAQELAAIDPDTISYIEAHGTGTELGDPIEVAALTQAFRRATQRTGFCAIGSVKTNIGHLDAAAGIASLTKVVLATKHGKLPPSLHFHAPNPKIDFAASPFFVNDRLRDWTPVGLPRRAGVSSFGVGGTNAHVVLEESPPPEPAAPSRPWQLLCLSARSPAALATASGNLAAHLAEHPDLNLADVAYTLQVGRKAFGHRRVIVANSPADASAALRGEAPPGGSAARAPRISQLPPRACTATKRRVAFLFPGQGAQHPQMARELYDAEPVFRQSVDRCCELLRPEIDVDLRSIMFPQAAEERAAARLTQTALAQPAIFVIEYALAELWRSWGLAPAACIGHSIGEYVAACLAGVFDLPTALRLVATRARLMNQMPAGAMLAVRYNEREIQPLLGGGVSLAAVNGPSLVVLSGPPERIDALETRLKQEGIGTVRLHASHAFHSAMMDPILAEFERHVARASLRPPQLPYLSNVTGTWIEPSEPTDPAYWSRHLRQTVRFSQGLETLLAQDYALLEVGPGRTLSGLASAHPACGPDRVVAASLRHPQQALADEASLLLAAGQLWLGGVAIDWHKVHAPHPRRRVPLPTYPFERQRYWALDDPATQPAAALAAPSKRDPSEWFYAPSWKRLPALAAAIGRSDEARSEAWLIFADHVGLADRLARPQDIVVEFGGSYQLLGPSRFQIEPQAKADYTRLFTHFRDERQLPAAIVHLAGVTQGQPLADAGRDGFYSLLYLAQALAETAHAAPVKIAVVTDGAHDAIGGEPIQAEKSLVQGPCRVLPQEFANITCRHIDLAVVPGAIDDATVRAIAAEIASDCKEPVVALRNAQRWAQTYEPMPLTAPAGDAATFALRSRGVYLITGGLGGMGLVLARWLAETVQARIVLTARTPLPPRGEWAAWLAAHDPADPTSRKIAGVQSLEAAGGEVLVVAADVADEGAMRRAVDEARARFGPLHGLVHAAGVAGGGIVQLKTREMAERVLRPKVDGLAVLTRVLAGEPLDFLVLCSSLSAVVGGFGQVDYCSANAFLDAFARQQRAAGGLPAVAINWNAWRDVGMAVETELPAQLRELRAQTGIADSLSNAEGIDAFRRILAGCREPQVAVSREDLPRLIEQHRRPPQLAEALLPAGPAKTQPRPDLPSPFVPPRTPTETAVAETWAAVFGFEQVGAEDDFFALGGHSLMALQLLERVRVRLGVSLALPDLFEHKTVEGLARHIDTLKWAAQLTAATSTGGESGDAAAVEREEFTL
jgi:acyl transferase domain-containing protein